MSKFNPAMLVPASQVEDFIKPGSQRTVQQVALDNIAKQKHLFQQPDEDGKRHFKVAGNSVSFTIRINNSALVLGQYEKDGVTADVKEMAVPKGNFIEALDYFSDKIKAGEFDGQLNVLSDKRIARTDKMRSTRAAKKAEPAKA